MSKSNKKKDDALGMSHGTAANRLRKSILFSLVVRLEENFCHQCGTEILSEADLSIEHKEPWLQAEDPVTSFFDLANIAFSHLSCNAGARKTVRRKYASEEEAKRCALANGRTYRAGIPKEIRQETRRQRYKKYGY